MTNIQSNGWQFVNYNTLKEENELSEFQLLGGSYALIQWEIPAGRREGTETPKECAIRELYEETGQIVNDMKLIGVIHTRSIKDEKDKYNPLFYAEVENLQEFKENEETSDIRLWNLKEKIGRVDYIDLRVAQLIDKLR